MSKTMAFTPTDGLRNTTSYPTIPADEAAARAQFMVHPDQLRDFVNEQCSFYSDTGAADAYIITPSPAITAYVEGQIFTFKAVNANTGASTINVNAKGAKTIKKNYNEDLLANDIRAGQVVKIVYDGTNFQMISNNNDVIETGSNANGKYVKLNDGTLICFGLVNVTTAVNTVFGSLFRSAGQPVTFAAEFVDANVSFAPYVNTAAAILMTANGNVTTKTAASVVLVSATSLSAATYSLSYMAIGRWKA
jgi:hypothetical protein